MSMWGSNFDIDRNFPGKLDLRATGNWSKEMGDAGLRQLLA